MVFLKKSSKVLNIMVYYKPMDSLNKVLTVVLGLVVVMVLFAVITSKLRLNRSGPFSFNRVGQITPVPTGSVTSSPTITPKKSLFSFFNKPQPTPTPVEQRKNPTTLSSQVQTTKAQTIPKTGPELFFPLVASTLAMGIYLRKKN